MNPLIDEMGYDNSLNRSPSNAAPRAYNAVGMNGLNRQPSRNFEQPYHPQQPALYGADLHQYEHRSTRLPPPQQQLYNSSYNHNPYSDWNGYVAGSNSATMGASSRMQPRPSNRRPALPTTWTDGTPQLSYNGPTNPYGQMPSQHMLPYSNDYSDTQSQAISQGGGSPNMADESDELIPTAIVIKNIPFAVKREAMQKMMEDMNLPVPYAFNYHFDSGIFRGLAFANFSSPDDTAVVISTMNGLELQGRKLRVEYKKMLPQQERERIEREKRERRGQLEEQHRPQPMGLQPQTSISSLNSQMLPQRSSPSPVNTRANGTGRGVTMGVLGDVDMNDPQTLQYYSQLLKFKDGTDPYITYEAPLPPEKRKILHHLSHFLGLHHVAHGSGDNRFLQIFKHKPDPAVQPRLLQHTSTNGYDDRRALARAATVDFSEIRPDPSPYPGLRSQPSDYLGVPQSPSGENGINRAGGLRGAKSFGDLQARTASPSSLSTSSFPAGLTQNASRYASEYNNMNGGHNGDVPTSTNGRAGQDESYLVNSFSSMSVFDRPLMPTRSNGRLGGLASDDGPSTSGPIGSQRPVPTNGTFDDQPRSSVAPERQPRVPTSNWNGFPRTRQNGHVGRSSDELDQHQLDEAWRRN